VRVAISNLRRAKLLDWTNSWGWNAREHKVTRTSNHYTLGTGLPRNTEIPPAPQQASEKGAAQVMCPALVKNRGNDAKPDRELANQYMAELAQRQRAHDGIP
jgi:hypothetical protein